MSSYNPCSPAPPAFPCTSKITRTANKTNPLTVLAFNAVRCVAEFICITLWLVSGNNWDKWIWVLADGPWSELFNTIQCFNDQCFWMKNLKTSLWARERNCVFEQSLVNNVMSSGSLQYLLWTNSAVVVTQTLLNTQLLVYNILKMFGSLERSRNLMYCLIHFYKSILDGSMLNSSLNGCPTIS